MMNPKRSVKMIEIGSSVIAVVERVEPYGVFLARDGDTIFLPTGNLAWKPNENPIGDIHVGDSMKVVVLRLNYEKKTYAGSLKHLHPENNPYRELSLMPIGTSFDGTVSLVHQNGVSVRLRNGCVGEIGLAANSRELKQGEAIRVQITALEVDEERLVLALAPTE